MLSILVLEEELFIDITHFCVLDARFRPRNNCGYYHENHNNYLQMFRQFSKDEFHICGLETSCSTFVVITLPFHMLYFIICTDLTISFLKEELESVAHLLLATYCLRMNTDICIRYSEALAVRSISVRRCWLHYKTLHGIAHLLEPYWELNTFKGLVRQSRERLYPKYMAVSKHTFALS